MPRASSRLADGQMFLRAVRKPLESSRGAAGRAFALRFVTVGRWPNVPQSSAKALGASRGRCGPGLCPALRHGWPMAKCSSEQCESPWSCRGASRAGPLLCASSRLADGQMFLRAARKPLGHRGASRAGLLPRASSRLADGQMFLRAARKPLGAQKGAAGRAFALRFVTA